MLNLIMASLIFCAPYLGKSNETETSQSIGLKCNFSFYADGEIGRNSPSGISYPDWEPKLNMKAIAFEAAAAGTLSSLSWYLVWLTRPWEHYEPFSLMFFEITAGAPLSAMAGTVLMGKFFKQKGSPWKSWVIGILGGVLGSLFAGNILILGGPDPDYAMLGLYVVIGTTVGSVIGYNSIGNVY